MRNNSKFLLSGFLLTTILLLNISFSSADPPDCVVIPSNNCQSPNVILMHVSGATNAHGALYNQPFSAPNDYVVCCQDIPVGDYTCTGNNKIVGLSSEENAHAEGPGDDSQPYKDNHVCYSSFSAVFPVFSEDGSAPTLADDEVLILKLSSETNAHITNADDTNPNYEWYVVGQIGEGGADECSLLDAYWEKNGQEINETTNYILSGNNIGLVVDGTDLCNGETIGFTIKEDTTPFESEAPEGTFSDGRADSTWTAQYMDLTSPNRPPRYFFEGEVSGVTPIESGKDDASLLTVYNSSNPVDSCSGYSEYFEGNAEENEIICERDPYEAAPYSVGPGINCDETSCFCVWDDVDGVCNPAWGGTDEGTCIIKNQQCNDEECKEGGSGVMTCSWEVEWTGEGNGEDYGCTPGERTIDCPAQIPLPFFGIYNFLAALLLIAAVYFVLSLRKQKKRR